MKRIFVILILFQCCVAGAQSSDEKAVATAVETSFRKKTASGNYLPGRPPNWCCEAMSHLLY